MNLTAKAPPNPSGFYKRDILRLYEWADLLLAQLKAALSVVESDDITSVKGGKIDISESGISGTGVEITDDSLTVSIDGEPVFCVSPKGIIISNRDQSEYIKLTNDSLEINVRSIKCDELTASYAQIDSLNDGTQV